MDASELLETITILIQQAQQGEIDPWDVQVVEVIDHFLELMVTEATKRGQEADLSQSGQAFLSASMLVLYKANTLMQMQTASVEPEVVNDTLLLPEDGVLYQTHRLPLEKQLRRRPTAMPPAKRPVTLQELVEQLQVMADHLKLVQQKQKNVHRVKRQPTLQTMRAALELAHQENLTEVAKELEDLLSQKAGELSLKQNWLNLEQLVQLWTQTKQPQPENTDHRSLNTDLVSVFWALLLLSAQSKVELIQEEFYQDVKIRLLGEVAASETWIPIVRQAG